MRTFYSHGKLLLTGEYLVLDGAKALAIPTKKGQSLTVNPISENKLYWKSVLQDGRVWFEGEFNLPLASNYLYTNEVVKTLHHILVEAQKLNPNFLQTGYTAVSTLEFPRDWGLGSSSTLITNIADWAAVNAYELLENTFGGSGYDIACAKAASPIIFSRPSGCRTEKQNPPTTEPVDFHPSFSNELFFVHLNKKQNSRESIAHYRSLAPEAIENHITEVSEITAALFKAKDIHTFEQLFHTHEQLISDILKTATIKSQLFPDYPRAIKSLGGWGGDFILATGTDKERAYFAAKGYSTIISYDEMCL